MNAFAPESAAYWKTRALAAEGQVETLEETLRQLRDEVTGEKFEPPVAWGLSPRHRHLVQLLCARDLVSKDFWATSWAQARGEWNEDLDPKGFDVAVCQLRRKVAPFGVEIVVVWGRGARLRDDQREAVRAACSGGPATVGEEVARPRRAMSVKARVKAFFEQTGDWWTCGQIAREAQVGTPGLSTILLELVEARVLEARHQPTGRGYLYARRREPEGGAA